MRSVKNWVLTTFILTFFVIIAGGVVRTTQSGMGCPDWPTCFGKWIPPTNASELPPDFEKYLKAQDIDHTFNVYHTWIEYFNRLAGVLLGFFAIIQLFLLYFKRKEQRQSYRLALAFLATVILTGLFGAIVVKLNLAHASISVHLLFAVVLTQLQLALLMSVRRGLSYIPVQKNIRSIVFGLLIVILIQSVLGTMVRVYVDDVSKASHYLNRDQWLAKFPIQFIIHRTFSWVVLLLTAFTAWYCRNEIAVRRDVYYLTANILLSMITGIVLYYLDMPAVAQPVHLLLATIAITQSVYILLKTKNG